jgi:hypothetical protein
VHHNSAGLQLVGEVVMPIEQGDELDVHAHVAKRWKERCEQLLGAAAATDRLDHAQDWAASARG